QVLRRAPVGRILLAHVAESAGKLRQPFTIGPRLVPLDLEMRWFDELWSADDGNKRFAIEAHGRKTNGTTYHRLSPHRASASMSCRYSATPAGSGAASAPSLSCVSGSLPSPTITPGLNRPSGSNARLTARKHATT